MPSQITAIKPYKWEGLWVFDDDRVGLQREAFVAGADTMIDAAVERKGIKDAEKGFLLLFSPDPFPGADVKLAWLRAEMGGNVYGWENLEGWLCPALFRYFTSAPPVIYAEFRAR